jgi:hypothetical protein
MPTIMDEVAAIAAERSRTRQAARKDDEAADARLTELVARLKAGETTGDALQDYLLVQYGGLYAAGTQDQVEPHYRDLERRMAGRAGEFVMMIERHEEVGGCMRSFNPLRECFKVGRLVSDRLAFDRLAQDDPKWRFPTERHLSHGPETSWDSDKVGVASGGIKPRSYDTLFWMKATEPMRFRDREGGGCLGPPTNPAIFSLGVDFDKPIHELQFVIGNDELDAWCRGLTAGEGRVRVGNGRVNEARVRFLRQIILQLGEDPDGIKAVAEYVEARKAEILRECGAYTLGLSTLLHDLVTDKEPPRPTELVKGIREMHGKLRQALMEADNFGVAGDEKVAKARELLSTFPA